MNTNLLLTAAGFAAFAATPALAQNLANLSPRHIQVDAPGADTNLGKELTLFDGDGDDLYDIAYVSGNRARVVRDLDRISTTTTVAGLTNVKSLDVLNSLAMEALLILDGDNFHTALAPNGQAVSTTSVTSSSAWTDLTKIATYPGIRGAFSVATIKTPTPGSSEVRFGALLNSNINPLNTQPIPTGDFIDIVWTNLDASGPLGELATLEKSGGNHIVNVYGFDGTFLHSVTITGATEAMFCRAASGSDDPLNEFDRRHVEDQLICLTKEGGVWHVRMLDYNESTTTWNALTDYTLDLGTLTSSPEPTDVACGDVDGDGAQDLVIQLRNAFVAEFRVSALLYRTVAAPNFSVGATATINKSGAGTGESGSIAMADINNSRHLQIGSGADLIAVRENHPKAFQFYTGLGVALATSTPTTSGGDSGGENLDNGGGGAEGEYSAGVTATTLIPNNDVPPEYGFIMDANPAFDLTITPPENLHVITDYFGGLGIPAVKVMVWNQLVSAPQTANGGMVSDMDPASIQNRIYKFPTGGGPIQSARIFLEAPIHTTQNLVTDQTMQRYGGMVFGVLLGQEFYSYGPTSLLTLVSGPIAASNGESDYFEEYLTANVTTPGEPPRPRNAMPSDHKYDVVGGSRRPSRIEPPIAGGNMTEGPQMSTVSTVSLAWQPL